MDRIPVKRTALALYLDRDALVSTMQGSSLMLAHPSTYPTVPRHFNCLRCGCDVFRPETDRFDDWICLNCRFGRVRAEQS